MGPSGAAMRWLWAWFTEQEDESRYGVAVASVAVLKCNAEAQWLYLPHTAQEPKR